LVRSAVPPARLTSAKVIVTGLDKLSGSSGRTWTPVPRGVLSKGCQLGL
jgi:hypothetical protein